MDLNLSNDPYDSYRIFQSRIIDQYDSMIQSEASQLVDGTTGIEDQQRLVRQKIRDILSSKQYHQSLRQKVMLTSNKRANKKQQF